MIPNWAEYKVKFYFATCYCSIEDAEDYVYRVIGINMFHTLLFELCYLIHMNLVAPFFPDSPLPFKILETLED
jgi:hypothetical protein